jgi:hypothetical protein
MQRLEVSGAVRHIYRPLGVKGLIKNTITHDNQSFEIIYILNWPLATVKTGTENTADCYTNNKMQKLELR